MAGVRWDLDLLEEHIDLLIIVLDHAIRVLSKPVNMVVQLWVELLLLERLVELVLLLLGKVVHAHFLLFVDYHRLWLVSVGLHDLVMYPALLELWKGCVSGVVRGAVVRGVAYAVHCFWSLVLLLRSC